MRQMPHYLELNPALLDTTGDALRADIVAGTEQALFGPNADTLTVETVYHQYDGRVGDTSYYIPQSYMARLACLSTPGTADFDEPLALAMSVRTSQINAETAASMSKETMQNLGYDSGNGVDLVLIRPPGKVFHLSLQYFNRPWCDNDKQSSAGIWSTGYGLDRRPPLSFFEAGLAIAEVLKFGETDEEVLAAVQSGELMQSREALWASSLPLSAIREQSLRAHGDHFASVTDQTTIEHCKPHLYSLFKRVVEAPNFSALLDEARELDVEAIQALLA